MTVWDTSHDIVTSSFGLRKSMTTTNTKTNTKRSKKAWLPTLACITHPHRRRMLLGSEMPWSTNNESFLLRSFFRNHAEFRRFSTKQ